MADTLSNAIKQIIDMDGIAAFSSSKRFNALLGDFAPELVTERKIISRVVNDELLLSFGALMGRNDGHYELLRIKSRLEDEHGLSERWSLTIVTGFADAMGCEHSLGTEEKEERTPPPVNNVGYATEPLPVYTPGYRTTSASFIVDTVEVFATNGTFDGKLTDGGTYLRGETSNIGIKVNFPAVTARVYASLVWQVFSSDGTAFTEQITGSLWLEPGENYMTQSWGWSEKGNWPADVYTVMASINGSPAVSAEFEIIDGCYERLPTYLEGIRFFHSPRGIHPELNSRRYAASFDKRTACTIGFQMDFGAPGRGMYTVINYVIADEYNQIVANRAVPLWLNPENDTCWTGYGYVEPGYWDKGRYTCSVSIGGSNAVSGTFFIV